MTTKAPPGNYLDTSISNTRLLSATTTNMIRATPAATAPAVRLENTYKLEPDNTFPYGATSNVIQEVLAEKLGTETYDANKVVTWSKEISETLRDRTKMLVKSKRYKVVSYVVIGEKDLGAIALASRCLWNEKYDTRSEAVFTNGSLYAIGVVYGFYFE